MPLLLCIAFAAGVITAVSPCVLPVLPIVLAGGAAAGSRRRALLVVAGLVVSFTTFTLFASVLLSALGLPQDALRNAAIALLFILAVTLAFPRVGLLLERPLLVLSRRRGGASPGGLALGVSLGLVFVPCAGPVLAAVSVLAARHEVTFDGVLLTLLYALGFGTVLAAVALGGERVARALRGRGFRIRRAMGVVIAAAAVAILLGLDTRLQLRLGGYSNTLQRPIEGSAYARSQLARLRGAAAARPAAAGVAQPGIPDFGRSPVRGELPDYGPAPALAGISAWLNTSGGAPVSLAALRGKVVLVDFWTYSCINCLRTLPHLRAWYAAYRHAGLEIVGVHTPEFAFERVLANVRAAARSYGVTWPVALDNGYATWTAYANEYWPAEYLIDRAGRIRLTHFGEGAYEETEAALRALLGSGAGKVAAVADTTPKELLTRETYLGFARLDPVRYRGATIARDRPARYPGVGTLPLGSVALAGTWTVRRDFALAGSDARLRLAYRARDVHVVLGGRGSVAVRVGGTPLKTIAVNGPRLYTVVRGPRAAIQRLERRVAAGVSVYSFTFG